MKSTASTCRVRSWVIAVAPTLLLMLVTRAAMPQIINTYAGGGAYVNSPPLSVAMKPAAIVIGPDGGIYVAVRSYNACDNDACADDTDEDAEIFRIDPGTGKVTRIAGNGVEGAAGIGGPPSNVSMNDPQGLAFDNAGNLYIADAGNNRILKVSADPAFNPADPAALAGGPITSQSVVSVFSTLSHPVSLAVDASSSNLYIATTVDGYPALSGVTRISLSGGTTTPIAGCGTPGIPGCAETPVTGVAATSTAILPEDGGNDLAFDSAGRLYIAAAGYDQIERILRVDTNSVEHTLTVVAGPESSTNGFGCTQPGNAGSVLLGYLAIAIDGQGNLLLDEGISDRVCRISPDPATGVIDANSPIASIAGGAPFLQFVQYGQPGYGDGGSASDAVFSYPDGIAVDHAGNVFVSDGTEGRVREIPVDPVTGIVDGDSIISTAAGAGADAGGDGNPATAATTNQPVGVVVDAQGDLFIGSDHVIRRVDAKTHVISTFAGHLGAAPETCPLPQNGEPAACASFSIPYGLAMDSAGNVYVSDLSAVERISTSGTVTTVAGGGSGSAGCGEGGLAVDACLSDVHGLAVDQAGDLYIADTGDNEIREVTTDGTIRTIAGTGQAASLTNCPSQCDGGAAVDVPVTPMYLVWSPEPNLVVMRGQQGTAPIAIGGGALYFTDSGTQSVRKIDLYDDTIAPLLVVTYWLPCSDNPNVPCPPDGQIPNAYEAFGYDGGTPTGIAMDAAGDLFVGTTRGAIEEATTPGLLEGQLVTTGVGITAAPTNGSDPANPYGILVGDGGPAIDATLSSPQALSIDSKGNLYVADEGFHRVRVISGVARARGDVNGDGQVNKNDLALIMGALNAPASGPNDVRDVNHDGVINLLDARILVTLCTYPGCGTSPPK